MNSYQTAKSMILAAGIAGVLASGACGRSEEPQSIAESQSQTARPANEPITVQGCLKAGDAEETFVLTSARSAGNEETATYQLAGAPNVNLRDHIGRRVEVSGTVGAQQEMASRTTAVPPADERPAGTTGTPKVETKAEIDIKRVSVTSVKPLDEKCEM